MALNLRSAFSETDEHESFITLVVINNEAVQKLNVWQVAIKDKFTFENYVPPTLDPTLNLTDTCNESKREKNTLADFYLASAIMYQVGY